MFRKLAGLTAVAGLFIAGTASAAGPDQITNSAHDFQGDGWNPGGQICVVCHTTHNGPAVQNAPLWNHTLSAGPFTTYVGVDIQGTIDDPSVAGGVSLLCLSCHDGTVALDAFGGAAGNPANTIDALHPAAFVDTVLTDDHPIAVNYSIAVQADMEDPATVSSGLGGTIDEDMLFAGKVECASCHDVHNGTGLPNLLIKSNAASDLCQTCHLK
jgi:predicted CXXCH cytochrome family protein